MDYYFILFILWFGFTVDASIIAVGPKDTDSIVGGNTTLYCTVDGLGSNTVVWRRHQSDIEYSRNRTIVASSTVNPDRYTVTGDDAEGTYNLEITGIIKEFDEVQYQCITEGDVFVDGSGPAKLRVHDEPMPPTCTVEPLDILEGNNVDFECVFESRISEVEMNLTSNSNSLFSAIVDPDLNVGRSTSSSTFVVTAEDDGGLLRCSVDHQIFDMPYYCSVTLNVKYKPIVEIKQEGTLSDGNASFTCGAVSNPDATNYRWSLCLGVPDVECIDPGDGILTIEQVDSNELVSECEVFGSNVSCQVFKNGETELPVYVVLNDDNLTIPENMTVTECLLKCSVMNTKGEGNDNYTIDDAICLTEIAPTTIMPTTPQPTTDISTTAMLSSSSSSPDITPDVDNSTKSTVNTIKDNNNNNDIERYYYIIGGLAGGTVVLFLITLMILICRNAKTDPDDDSSVSPTHWTHYANTGYEDNGGFTEQNDTVIYSPDNPFKTFGKENLNQNTQNDSENVYSKDTLPMSDDNKRQEPEGGVNDVTEEDVGTGNGNTNDVGSVHGTDGGVAGTGSYDATIALGEPQYAVVNKSSFRQDKPSLDVLDTVDGVTYMDQSDPYTEINHNKRPSITQI